MKYKTGRRQKQTTVGRKEDRGRDKEWTKDEGNDTRWKEKRRKVPGGDREKKGTRRKDVMEGRQKTTATERGKEGRRKTDGAGH